MHSQILSFTLKHVYNSYYTHWWFQDDSHYCKTFIKIIIYCKLKAKNMTHITVILNVLLLLIIIVNNINIIHYNAE